MEKDSRSALLTTGLRVEKPKSALRNYVSRREQELHKCHNQSALYKYINCACGNRALPIKLTNSFGNIVSPGIDTANIFNTEFADNFLPIDAPPISHDSSGHQFNITLLDTYTALCAAPCSSAGPDGVPGELLRRLAAVLALPLSIVFQQSVVQECFPSSWKEAIVMPIYKGNGLKDKASSYRLISLCSTIGKTLERIVKTQLLSLVNKHSAMNSAQHSFMNKRSTITNLLITERHLAEAVNSRESMDVISFDFSRAFD